MKRFLPSKPETWRDLIVPAFIVVALVFTAVVIIHSVRTAISRSKAVQVVCSEEILRKTNELKCDTIVLGAHGKGFIENTFLGSTAKRVLRRTRCPVYIVPILAEHTDSKVEEM